MRVSALSFAMIGSIKDEVVNAEELSLELLKMLHGHYEGVLANRYEIEETEDTVKRCWSGSQSSDSVF